MAADRPFPPSTRRLALARAAGLTPASPLLVGALACAAAAIALASLGAAMAARLGASVRAAIAGADGSSAFANVEPANANGASATIGADGATLLSRADDVVSAIIAFALPMLGAIAIAAVIAHLAQTRAVWIPRREVANAPAEDPQRGTRGMLAIANACVIAFVALAWLYAMAPRLAAITSIGVGDLAPLSSISTESLWPTAGSSGSLAQVDSTAARIDGGTSRMGDIAASGALLLVSSLAALAIAWAILGAIDALVRFAAHARSLRMTHEEQRADQRLAGADPRWRARREKLARGEPVRDAVAGASLLVLGDGVAVAVAWDPIRRPVPLRTASGRAARATQLLGLARRYAIAVHRDAELATLLAAGEGPVPETHWPRLAVVMAATRDRR